MFETIVARDWMTSPAITVKPSARISDAHFIMKERGIRRLPVVENDRLVGIITIGDVREASPSDATTLSIWELNYLWAQLTVERVMTRDIVTVKADTPMLDVAQIMLDKKISGIPVVDNENHIVGIITESDVFRMLVRSRVANAE